VTRLEHTLYRVAAFGVSTATDERLVPDPLHPDAWSSLVAEVHRARLVGLLEAAVDAGAFAVTEDQRTELAELHLRWCATSLELERDLLEVVSVLEAAGVEVLVLKGAAHAHLLYPDPAQRCFGDNDVLVHGHDLPRAIQALERLGYRRAVPPLRAGFDRRYGKGATLRRPDGRELDLHRTLLFGTYGLLVDPAGLFARADHLLLGNRSIAALGREDRLLHGCLHSALGDPEPRLASLRDVVQAASAGVDAEAFRDLVRRRQAGAVVARTVQLIETRLVVEAPAVLRGATPLGEPTRRHRRAIAAYVGRDRSFRAKVVASLPFLPSAYDRAAFLLAAAAPAAPIRERFGGRYGWYLRGARRR
jgi:hypothetical protein